MKEKTALFEDARFGDLSANGVNCKCAVWRLTLRLSVSLRNLSHILRTHRLIFSFLLTGHLLLKTNFFSFQHGMFGKHSVSAKVQADRPRR